MFILNGSTGLIGYEVLYCLEKGDPAFEAHEGEFHSRNFKEKNNSKNSEEKFNSLSSFLYWNIFCMNRYTFKRPPFIIFIINVHFFMFMSFIIDQITRGCLVNPFTKETSIFLKLISKYIIKIILWNKIKSWILWGIGCIVYVQSSGSIIWNILEYYMHNNGNIFQAKIWQSPGSPELPENFKMRGCKTI